MRPHLKSTGTGLIRKGVAQALALVLGGIASWHAQAQVTDLRADEEICFFPSLAASTDGGQTWRIEVHGCVYEPEDRPAAMALLKTALHLGDVEMTAAEKAIFAERARLFLRDNERGKRIVVGLGDHIFPAGKSAPNGHFSTTLILEARELGTANPEFQFQAVLPAGDSRSFSGVARRVPDRAPVVVSDIDDTIKVSAVTNPKLMLRNTFLEPFKPVAGMAPLYRGWAESHGAAFLYVSASPWQLYPPLAGFVRSNGFPEGVFFLKDFRMKDRTVKNLFEDPENYKPRVIEPLLARLPQSRFVLVGDSGEKDPEIYGALARRHPTRIAAVFIRDVTGESGSTRRYQAAFSGVPPGRWHVFQRPEELADAWPAESDR